MNGAVGVQQLDITGMTCTACAAKVKALLGGVRGVRSVEVDLATAIATIGTDAPVTMHELAAGLVGTKYAIAAPVTAPAVDPAAGLRAYYPLALIFAFITAIVLLAAYKDGALDGMRSMAHFMAGFFLAFSFFKLLDLRGFADSYAGYDLLAKRWRGYGFVYPFIELALGIAYLIGAEPVLTNYATIGVMGFSTIGVMRAVLNKQRIQCACLGTVFKLPMSTVTIAEDVLMVAMAVAMLLLM